MNENGLTQQQITWQDFVDNAIFDLIRSVNPIDKELNWDIEMIGEVRDILREWFVIKVRITEEQEIYPSLGEGRTLEEITD
jgi:hypothetical protein